MELRSRNIVYKSVNNFFDTNGYCNMSFDFIICLEGPSKKIQKNGSFASE